LPGIGSAIANGIAIREEQFHRKLPRLWACCWWTGTARPLRDEGASRADQPQVKVGLGVAAHKAEVTFGSFASRSLPLRTDFEASAGSVETEPQADIRMIATSERKRPDGPEISS